MTVGFRSTTRDDFSIYVDDRGYVVMEVDTDRFLHDGTTLFEFSMEEFRMAVYEIRERIFGERYDAPARERACQMASMMARWVARHMAREDGVQWLQDMVCNQTDRGRGWDYVMVPAHRELPTREEPVACLWITTGRCKEYYIDIYTELVHVRYYSYHLPDGYGTAHMSEEAGANLDKAVRTPYPPCDGTAEADG